MVGERQWIREGACEMAGKRWWAREMGDERGSGQERVHVRQWARDSR